MSNSNFHISIDVTDAKECAVAKDKFRIIDFSGVAGAQFEDLVHNSAPFFHFQILRPKDDEQRTRALDYFKKNTKLHITFENQPEILLYVGCTQNVYIKSGIADFETDDLKNIMSQAAHWFRFYGNEIKKGLA